MLLARGFSYADAHRARLGVNYQQIPVNTPSRRSAATPRTARCGSTTSPTRCTRRTPTAVRRRARATAEPAVWAADGEMVRAAYSLRPRTTTAARPAPWFTRCWTTPARLVDNIVGRLLDGVTEPVLARAFEYWRNIDKELGDKVEAGVRGKQGERDPKAAEQANPARESMQAKA